MNRGFLTSGGHGFLRDGKLSAEISPINRATRGMLALAEGKTDSGTGLLP